MRLVLDTNVIISGLFWKGIPGQILEDALKEKYTLCFSQDTLIELQKVLNYSKFKLEIQKLTFSLEEFSARLTEKALVVSLPKIELEIIKEHPSDNKFLACARSCGASFIVSGDKHLLKLKQFQNIPILSPQQFLKHFKPACRQAGNLLNYFSSRKHHPEQSRRIESP